MSLRCVVSPVFYAVTQLQTSDAGEAGNVQSSMSKADRQKYVSDLVRFVLFASNDGSTIRGSGTDNKKGIKEVLGLAAGNSIEIVELANKTLEKVCVHAIVCSPPTACVRFACNGLACFSRFVGPCSF